MLCQVLRIFCILNLHFENPSLAPLQPVLSANLILEMGSLWLVESGTQSSLWFRSICALSPFLRSLIILHKMRLLMKYASCLLPYNLFSQKWLCLKASLSSICKRTNCKATNSLHISSIKAFCEEFLQTSRND